MAFALADIARLELFVTDLEHRFQATINRVDYSFFGIGVTVCRVFYSNDWHTGLSSIAASKRRAGAPSVTRRARVFDRRVTTAEQLRNPARICPGIA